MVSGIVQSNDNKRKERYHHEWLEIVGDSSSNPNRSANLESLDPFSDIDLLISEVKHENNINIAEINEGERENFVTPAFDFYENESDSDEDIYAPEDDHRNVFDI